MSLIKQLWLAIIVLLLLSFVGSLAISINSSRAYIEQEVRIKNEDNATALALSMSQLDKELVILELLIAAQFDTGYYRSIVLRDAEGDVLVERHAGEYSGDVPGWFRSLVQFDVPVGTATIQDGWRQFGTLELESQHSFAYASLWRSMLELAGWFLLAGAISLTLATVMVRGIKHPLVRVVAQAKDISARRFTTIKEPRTLELREVAQAMNVLSANVRQMLSQESEKLDRLRRKLQQDEVTDAANRDHFMQLLGSELDADSSHGNGSLALVRLARLAQINEILGHQETNRLLGDVVNALKQLISIHGGGHVGRLNGSDFALLLPGDNDLTTLAEALKTMLHPVIDSRPVPIGLPMAVVDYTHGDVRGDLLSALDGALARAEADGDHALVVATGANRQSLYNNREDWRQAIGLALDEGIQLAHYPVLDSEGQLLHYESPSRLRLKNQWQPAGVFMPWISRLSLNVEFDLAVVKAALIAIETENQPLGINLSQQAAQDSRFISGIKPLLKQYPDAATKLWLELPELIAVHHLEGFRGLCREMQPFGCQMGLEHVGPEFSRIADIHDVGLAYLKIDASLVNDIDRRLEQQALLRGMATLAHSLDILVIAEGVKSDAERLSVLELGFDGATGPGVRQ